MDLWFGVGRPVFGEAWPDLSHLRAIGPGSIGHMLDSHSVIRLQRENNADQRTLESTPESLLRRLVDVRSH